MRHKLHRLKQTIWFAWHKKAIERMPKEIALGVSFGWSYDPYLGHHYLCIGFLLWGLYIEWEY